MSSKKRLHSDPALKQKVTVSAETLEAEQWLTHLILAKAISIAGGMTTIPRFLVKQQQMLYSP